jgi:hypothetical protein
MRRARENLKRIAGRLEKSGYCFANPGDPVQPLGKNVIDQLMKLDSVAGPLPLFFGAALQYLGAIDFSGDHPDWPRTANVMMRPATSQKRVWLTDPFVLAPVRSLLSDALDHQPRGTPFALAFAGDPVTKAGYSGGAYGIRVPSAAADPLVVGESKHRTFVAHLRIALRFGGFAGFAAIAGRPRDFIRRLVVGLPSI